MQRHFASLLVLLCLSVGLGVGGSVSPVGAYPPGCATVTTNASSYAPGSTVTITAIGTADDAGSLVTFTITLQSSGSGFASGLLPTSGEPIITVVTAVANSEGVAIITITAPSALGTYVVTITNITCGDVSSSFEVETVVPTTTVPPGTPPGLPRAGGNPQEWLYSAGIVMFTGYGLWLVARRRRGQRSATRA